MLLPTPAAGAFNDGEDPDQWEARRLRVKDATGNGNGFGTPLSIAVQLLPTPRATRGGSVTEQSYALGGVRDDSDRPQGRVLLPTPTPGYESRWGAYASAIARHERAFGRPAPAPTEPGPKGNPRLSARFVEWMQMLPVGHVTDVPGLSRSQQLHALGNGVVPPQGAAALRWLLRWLP